MGVSVRLESRPSWRRSIGMGSFAAILGSGQFGSSRAKFRKLLQASGMHWFDSSAVSELDAPYAVVGVASDYSTVDLSFLDDVASRDLSDWNIYVINIDELSIALLAQVFGTTPPAPTPYMKMQLPQERALTLVGIDARRKLLSVLPT